MASLIHKGRKPKFELHLRIFDLNNVPLVSGTSSVKWHLSGSMHAEHRGRTPKCAISNHRVEFNYSKVVGSIRIGVDRNNYLTECPIELEVFQEFSMVAAGGGGGRDEKIALGVVRLNLSEYVEESEGLSRETTRDNQRERRHLRRRSAPTAGGMSPKSPTKLARHDTDDEGEDDDVGIVRRYLMQESKINSTLKIGILMVQVDGERNFVAPALKTAPVFGGIAGIMAGDPVEPDDGGQLPSISKSRDAAEVQDVYRSALAASWACQPGELSADECIEDIFAGGDGWRSSTLRRAKSGRHGSVDDDASGDEAGGHGGGDGSGTLRPSDVHRLFRLGGHRHLLGQASDVPSGARPHHRRNASGASDKSVVTVTGSGRDDGASGHGLGTGGGLFGRRNDSRDNLVAHGGGGISGGGGSGGESRSRSHSLVSITTSTTAGSSSDRDGRGRESGFRRAREVDEFEMRDDMVAWRLPGAAVLQR